MWDPDSTLYSELCIAAQRHEQGLGRTLGSREECSITDVSIRMHTYLLVSPPNLQNMSSKKEKSAKEGRRVDPVGHPITAPAFPPSPHLAFALFFESTIDCHFVSLSLGVSLYRA